MSFRPSPFVLGLTGVMTGFLLAGWRSAPAPVVAVNPFVVGEKWHAPNGLECKIEQIQGDWIRVSTDAALPGFPPSAIWVYGPTGTVWTRD